MRVRLAAVDKIGCEVVGCNHERRIHLQSLAYDGVALYGVVLAAIECEELVASELLVVGSVEIANLVERELTEDCVVHHVVHLAELRQIACLKHTSEERQAAYSCALHVVVAAAVDDALHLVGFAEERVAAQQSNHLAPRSYRRLAAKLDAAAQILGQLFAYISQREVHTLAGKILVEVVATVRRSDTFERE